MRDNRRGTISVMIPCYNEEKNVRPIYEAVRDELRRSCPEYGYEILFIDNRSGDRTREILEEICREDPHVRAIFNLRNYGQFNSPWYGIQQTSGDCVITMCADFQDPVELIPRFVEAWEQGWKIVIGRKTRSRENPALYFLRGCYYKLIRSMSSVEIVEQFTGFGLYDRSMVDIFRELRDPTPFIRGIVAEMGPDRYEIEYEQPRRRAGKTHNNFFTLYDAAVLSFTSYTKFGMRLATFAGAGIAALSFLAGLIRLFLPSSGTGGAAVLAVFFMGGVQLAFLGFLGEYVMSINARVMNRPLVLEERRINFDRPAPVAAAHADGDGPDGS